MLADQKSNASELWRKVDARTEEIEALREEDRELKQRLGAVEEWLSENVNGGRFSEKEPKPWDSA